MHSATTRPHDAQFPSLIRENNSLLPSARLSYRQLQLAQGRLVRQPSSTVFSSTITHVCERQARPFVVLGAVLFVGLHHITTARSAGLQLALTSNLLHLANFGQPINRSSILSSCARLRLHRPLFVARVSATALKGKAAGGQSLCQVRATSYCGSGRHHGQPVRRPRMPRARSSPHCTTVFLLDWLLLPLILKLSPLLPLVLLLLRSQPR